MSPSGGHQGVKGEGALPSQLEASRSKKEAFLLQPHLLFPQTLKPSISSDQEEGLEELGAGWLWQWAWAWALRPCDLPKVGPEVGLGGVWWWWRVREGGTEGRLHGSLAVACGNLGMSQEADRSSLLGDGLWGTWEQGLMSPSPHCSVCPLPRDLRQ